MAAREVQAAEGRQAAAGKGGAAGYFGELGAFVRLTWPLLLGNTLEWYEFGVYAYVEKQMQENFFGGSVMSTWLGFSVTFVSRPLGGLVLGWIADNLGRRLSVNLSLAGMLIATVGQGLLPSRYLLPSLRHVGLVVLLILRALQGLSAGGEIGAITSYIVETGELRTLGMAISLISVGSQISWALASGGIALLSSALGEEAMLVWGWRVPFIIALIPGVIGLWGRNNIPETEAFLQECQERAAEAEAEAGASAKPKAKQWAVAELVSAHLPALLVSAGGAVGIATMWYVPPFWTVSTLLEPVLGNTDALWIGNMAQLVGLAATPLAGWLTDRYGVGWVTLVGAAFFALTALPVYVWLHSSPADRAVAYTCVGVFYGGAQGFAGATIYLFCAELFPARLRCIGLALSYNLAVSYIGGFGCTISEALFRASPQVGPGAYFAACGAVSVLAVLAGLALQRRGVLQLSHRRAQPYFGRAAPAACPPAAAGKAAASPAESA